MYIANPEKSSPLFLHTWKKAPNGPHKNPFAVTGNPGAMQRLSRSDRIPARRRGRSKRPKNRDRVCFFCFCGVYYISSLYFAKTGEMAERSKAAVSKTVNGIFPFGGSNPPLSASFFFSTKSLLFSYSVSNGVPTKKDVNWDFLLSKAVTRSSQTPSESPASHIPTRRHGKAF